MCFCDEFYYDESNYVQQDRLVGCISHYNESATVSDLLFLITMMIYDHVSVFIRGALWCSG